MAARKTRPAPRWAGRMAQARTPEEQLTVTCDRLRASLKHLHRPRRDPATRAAAEGMAARLAVQAHNYLTGLCEEIERAERNDAA